jgi:two-component response regulator (ARR-A family)
VTWLLVEDDPDIRNVVAVMMQLWGEKSLALPDGNAAWNWLDSVVAGTYKGDLPELALMDIRMPGHTGDQIAARIRETAALKQIPIVLMTAFTLTDNEVQAMMARAGVDHLIKKPLPDMDEFKTTLYQVRDEKRKRVAMKMQSAALAEALNIPAPPDSTPAVNVATPQASASQPPAKPDPSGKTPITTNTPVTPDAKTPITTNTPVTPDAKTPITPAKTPTPDAKTPITTSAPITPNARTPITTAKLIEPDGKTPITTAPPIAPEGKTPITTAAPLTPDATKSKP